MERGEKEENKHVLTSPETAGLSYSAAMSITSVSVPISSGEVPQVSICWTHIGTSRYLAVWKLP